MQVKLFTIRLDDANLEIDQNSLNDFLETVKLIKSDCHFIESEVHHWNVLLHYELPETLLNTTIDNIQLNQDQELIFQGLKKWRNQKAEELGLKHFLICYNSELQNVAIKQPKTLNDLKKIKGFGNLKIQKYGNEIISVLNC